MFKQNSSATFLSVPREIWILLLGSLNVFLHEVHLKRPSFNNQYVAFQHFGQHGVIIRLIATTGSDIQTLP